MWCTGVSSNIDDEYKWAGVEDPKVLVTSSRDPSSRLKMFTKVSVKAVSMGHPGGTKLSSRLQSDASFKNVHV